MPALAKQINAAYGEVDRATLLVTDARINVGNLLKLARERMPERGAFAAWCQANIKRSKTDIYRCLALVKSDDPDDQLAAREAEKATARESVAASREAAKPATVPNVGDKALTAINAAKPTPSQAVWSEAGSTTRDKDISAQANKLASLTGYPLAKQISEQIILLRGNRWDSIPADRRTMLAEELRKLANEIAPTQKGT